MIHFQKTALCASNPIRWSLFLFLSLSFLRVSRARRDIFTNLPFSLVLSRMLIGGGGGWASFNYLLKRREIQLLSGSSGHIVFIFYRSFMFFPFLFLRLISVLTFNNTCWQSPSRCRSDGATRIQKKITKYVFPILSPMTTRLWDFHLSPLIFEKRVKQL